MGRTWGQGTGVDKGTRGDKRGQINKERGGNIYTGGIYTVLEAHAVSRAVSVRI